MQMAKLLIAYDTTEGQTGEAGKDTDTSKNHEYTDWTAVGQFVDGFLAHLDPQKKGSEHG